MQIDQLSCLYYTSLLGGSVKLILNNLLSTRDYAVFYPVLVHISAHIRHEFVE